MEPTQQARAYLAECINSVPKTLCAFLATSDGHMISLFGNEPENGRSISDILPLTGSMVGLARTVVSELQPGTPLDDILIRNKTHVLSLTGVAGEGDVLFVGVYAERMVNLGMLLVKAKECADNIQKLLSA